MPSCHDGMCFPPLASLVAVGIADRTPPESSASYDGILLWASYWLGHGLA